MDKRRVSFMAAVGPLVVSVIAVVVLLLTGCDSGYMQHEIDYTVTVTNKTVYSLDVALNSGAVETVAAGGSATLAGSYVYDDYSNADYASVAIYAAVSSETLQERTVKKVRENSDLTATVTTDTLSGDDIWTWGTADQ